MHVQAETPDFARYTDSTRYFAHLTDAVLRLFVVFRVISTLRTFLFYTHVRFFDLSPWKRFMGTAESGSAKFANEAHALVEGFCCFFLLLSAN